MRGQGATEYLVLLAVVLIVALVSVALLGFFPGMASDSQVTQSKAYWSSASPIAIIETAAAYRAANAEIQTHLRFRNTGAYPIRITGIVGADGNVATTFYGASCGLTGAYYNISDYFYMGPGEEKYLSSYLSAPCFYQFLARLGASSGMQANVNSICQNSSSAPGTLIANTFGFTYTQYIDGQQISKKQIGKILVVKCLPPV
jgi:hypothetical protein